VVAWRQFVNLGNHLENLISKAQQGENGGLTPRSACDSTPISDSRRADAGEWATLRTQLGRSESTHLTADYKTGMRVSGLIEKYGVSRSSVYEHLKKNGVKLDKNLLEEHRIDRAIELYQSGMTLVRLPRKSGQIEPPCGKRSKREHPPASTRQPGSLQHGVRASPRMFVES